jgi:hypothetical protein
MLAVATPASATFFQGFETDTSGWTGAMRVPSGTNGIPSKAGAFHAEDQNLSGLTYTFWGGDSKTFPPGGYTTSVDIYLDIAPPYMTGSLMPYANDTRFDWSSAIGTPSCNHRRDFVFNAGFYTDTDITGAGPRFVISASNNATRSGAFPKNPAGIPSPSSRRAGTPSSIASMRSRPHPAACSASTSPSRTPWAFRCTRGP